jgi:hypothetical protein
LRKTARNIEIALVQQSPHWESLHMRVKSAVRIAATSLALLSLLYSASGQTQTPAAVTIKWEVKSRFRLFKDESDFIHMVQSHGNAGVLADETALARATNGVGWASAIVTRLCVNSDGGLQDPCEREYSEADQPTSNEPYVVPDSHRVAVSAQGAPAGALCTWKFVTVGEESNSSIKRDQPCGAEIVNPMPYGKTTHVQLFVATHPEDSQPTATTDVTVRDILIAGLGDSTAAGEGNPDREVPLDSSGFCFRRIESPDDRAYFRPGRAGYVGDHSCDDSSGTEAQDAVNWSKIRALWMDRACHRSLYSYQIRVALALAIENPHIAVTYIPLGCTGATIPVGLLGRQESRESDCVLGSSPRTCSRFVPGQIGVLQQLLSAARRHDQKRNLDLVLLTVGANDIGFSGLVANVMIDHTTKEFSILRKIKGGVVTVAQAEIALQGLPGEFATLRAQLKTLLGNNLQNLVYVSYGNPALQNSGQPCSGGRQGFDVHPAFTIDAGLLKSTSDFVKGKFFPRLKAVATCGSGGGCQSSEQDRMTFVDDHQAEFENHGFCARADDDPVFDQNCFRANGQSFRSDQSDATASNPMACGRLAASFHAYYARARWIRTANDSYFTAMTYPDGIAKFEQPANIHDALWGVYSAVYGGAMHPTAQGYAAMADAALPAARRLLGLPPPQ